MDILVQAYDVKSQLCLVGKVKQDRMKVIGME